MCFSPVDRLYIRTFVVVSFFLVLLSFSQQQTIKQSIPKHSAKAEPETNYNKYKYKCKIKTGIENETAVYIYGSQWYKKECSMVCFFLVLFTKMLLLVVGWLVSFVCFVPRRTETKTEYTILDLLKAPKGDCIWPLISFLCTPVYKSAYSMHIHNWNAKRCGINNGEAEREKKERSNNNNQRVTCYDSNLLSYSLARNLLFFYASLSFSIRSFSSCTLYMLYLLAIFDQLNLVCMCCTYTFPFAIGQLTKSNWKIMTLYSRKKPSLKK